VPRRSPAGPRTSSSSPAPTPGRCSAFEEALERARRYRDAGADLLFVEALQSEDEIARAAAALGDVPLVFNWAEGGKTPPLELERLRQLCFRLAIFPISTLLTTVRAVGDVVARIRTAGTPLPVLAELPTFAEFVDFIGLPEIQDLERRFASSAGSPPRRRRDRWTHSGRARAAVTCFRRSGPRPRRPVKPPQGGNDVAGRLTQPPLEPVPMRTPPRR
jgi:hypothetical protein